MAIRVFCRLPIQSFSLDCIRVLYHLLGVRSGKQAHSPLCVRATRASVSRSRAGIVDAGFNGSPNLASGHDTVRSVGRALGVPKTPQICVNS